MDANDKIIKAMAAQQKELEDELKNVQKQIQDVNAKYLLLQKSLNNVTASLNDVQRDIHANNDVSINQILAVLENVTRPVHVHVDTCNCNDVDDEDLSEVFKRMC